VLVIPVIGDLTISVIELRVSLAALILGRCIASTHDEECYCRQSNEPVDVQYSVPSGGYISMPHCFGPNIFELLSVVHASWDVPVNTYYR